MKVLMIEDEKRLSEAVAQVLRKNQYLVDLAFDGDSGLEYILTGIYDLIILDIMLPKRNGLLVLREMRAHKMNTPVILLTAKGEVEDKIAGLDSGADDYLTKPFATGELLARMRALSRRPKEVENDGVMTIGDVELYPNMLRLSGPTYPSVCIIMRLTMQNVPAVENAPVPVKWESMYVRNQMIWNAFDVASV